MLAAALAAVLAPAAHGSAITYECGHDLCRIDPAHPSRVVHVTADGTKKAPYSSPSVSPSGRRMAFFRGEDLYFASASGKGRRKLKSRGSFPGQAFLGPDGFTVASIESVLLPNVCPIGVFVCGSSYTPYLYLHRVGEKEPTGVARSVVSSGWLGDRLMRDQDPDGDAPQTICVLKANDDSDCDRTVAADPDFALYSPAGSPDGRYVAATKVTPADAEKISLDGRIGLFSAATGALIRDLTRGTGDTAAAFSPDGRLVAFNRGRDLFVVRTDGKDLGKAKLLRRHATNPTWSK